MMDAQEEWKRIYRCMKMPMYFEKYDALMSRRNSFLREAALERKLAAAQRKAGDLEIRLHAMHDELIHACDEWGKAERTIEAQTKQIEELGKAYDRMRDTVMDLTL